MSLSPQFYDLTLLPRAEREAEKKIAEGSLTLDGKPNYIRGFCKLPSGKTGTKRPATKPNTDEDSAMITTTDITAKTITDIATKDLVAWYNAHAESTIKKFATRAKAEERCLALAATLTPKPAPAKRKPAAGDAIDRSAAVADTWKDPAISAARRQRHPVEVGGVVYRSVRTAFAELGLPDNQHQKFRKELVAARRATFEGHVFTVVEAE